MMKPPHKEKYEHSNSSMSQLKLSCYGNHNMVVSSHYHHSPTPVPNNMYKSLSSNSSSTNHNYWRESRDDNSTLQLNKNSTHVATDTGSQLGSTDHCRDHSRM